MEYIRGKFPRKEDVPVIQRIADRVGVTVNWERGTDKEAQWNGIDIAGMNSSSNIIHDIAHWCLASKKRRKLPDFGLGDGPETPIELPRLVSEKFQTTEERAASLLGILMEREHDLPWHRTWDYHSWNQVDDGFMQVSTYLYSRGLISEDLTPTYQSIQPYQARKIKNLRQKEEEMQMSARKADAHLFGTNMWNVLYYFPKIIRRLGPKFSF